MGGRVCPLNYPHGVTSWAAICEVMGWFMGGFGLVLRGYGLAHGWSDGMDWRGSGLVLRGYGLTCGRFWAGLWVV